MSIEFERIASRLSNVAVNVFLGRLGPVSK